MIVRFAESFDLPAAAVYDYFKTPPDWTRLFGFAGSVQDRGEGWYAVPLKRFPFPLVARIAANEPSKLVRWTFRGFWKGEGEVHFTERSGGVLVEGYERIGMRWLGPLSGFLERGMMEREFNRTWAVGWRRLREGKR